MKNLNAATDEMLVDMYIKGNDIAFDVLMKRYESKVYSYIYYAVKNQELAEDLFLIRKLSGENYGVFTENREIMANYKSLLKGFNNMAMGCHKLHAFTPDEVDQIRDKVTYLVGTEDPFEKIGGKEVLLRNRMNAVFYDGAGHGLNHELAGEINRKIISILLDT